MQQAGKRALFRRRHVQNFGEQVRLDKTDEADHRDRAEAGVGQRDEIPAGDAGLEPQRTQLHNFCVGIVVSHALTRLGAAHGDPMHAAHFGVVADGVMLRTTVVPHGDGVGAPAKATLVLRQIDVAIQHVE